MDIYSTSQFLSAFLGGVIGGLALARYGLTGVFGVTAVMALLWLAVAVGMRPPRHLASRVLRLPMMDEAKAQALGLELSRVGSIVKTMIFTNQKITYLKINNNTLNKTQLTTITSPNT